jgi:tRNA 2-thiouridine synthesizing protein A
MSHHELDARHVLCPLPVIRTQDRLKTLAPGDTLEVHCTDPGALNDIPTWARINGHAVVSAVHNDEVVITIRVGDER